MWIPMKAIHENTQILKLFLEMFVNSVVIQNYVVSITTYTE